MFTWAARRRTSNAKILRVRATTGKGERVNNGNQRIARVWDDCKREEGENKGGEVVSATWGDSLRHLNVSKQREPFPLFHFLEKMVKWGEYLKTSESVCVCGLEHDRFGFPFLSKLQ